jgi:hypothetical protein
MQSARIHNIFFIGKPPESLAGLILLIPDRGDWFPSVPAGH